MAGLQLSDEEQSERLKQWWKENGTSIITGAVLGIAVIVGVNYWRSYKADQAESASLLYRQLLDAPGESDTTDIAGQLMDDYSSTPYAGKAALMRARVAFDNDNMEQTKQYLEWAVNNASDPADRRVAKLRLARVALSLDELDEADALLSQMDSGGYESEYRELLGDLAVARNDWATARENYQAALQSLPDGSRFAGLLNMKLDAATGASQ